MTWNVSSNIALPPAGVVHLWWTSSNASAIELSDLKLLLSVDELARAMQFRFPEDRERYIVRRGRLRLLLGRYLGIEPGCLRFSYGQHGKPALAAPRDAARLRFNLSHSGDSVLYGVSGDQDLGVDLEQVQPIDLAPMLTSQFFSARELRILQECSGSDQRAAFFTCWTLKEAYVKGTGEGLTAKLADIDVSALLTGRNAMEQGNWVLRQVDVGAGYRGAVALAGDLVCIEPRVWPQHVSAR